MEITQALLKKFITIAGSNNVSVLEKDLHSHAKDKSFYKPSLPDVVIWPKNTKQVSSIVKLANKHRIPVTARGAGSSLMGNPIPAMGGIVLNMTKMNKVLKIHSQGLQVRVQPGVVCDDLNRELEPHGIFFPAFPGSSHIATIGGLIANNAGGMYAVKYGVTGDWVMHLTVVLANGDIMHVGSHSIKSVTGYNLISLFIGSEGTLGIVTEATLRVCPKPQREMAALVAFNTTEDLNKTIVAILQSSLQPAALELLDKNYVALANKAQRYIVLQERDTLLIELHGKKEMLEVELRELETLCKSNHHADYQTFTTPEACDKLWGCRKGVRLIFQKLSPDTGILSAEVGVPLRYVPEFIQKVKEIYHKYHVKVLNHGHVGDGNFHTWVLYKLNSEISLQKAQKINDELIHYAIDVGGTATGEHGLGLGKREYLAIEHPTSIGMMKQIKLLFDPKGILNPGKIFPDYIKE